MRNSLDSTVLFIRKAERWDSGSYELKLKVGDEEMHAKIEVAVIGKCCFINCVIKTSNLVHEIKIN